MSKSINLNRGLDLRLEGELTDLNVARKVIPDTIAICPDDYPGFTPKLCVHPGDVVIAGQPLMRDKINESINLVSTVCGTVKEVVRGERRKILRVEVNTDTSRTDTVTFGTKDSSSAEKIMETLMKSGLWAMMRQRPYDIVPSPAVRPANIFVTGFDSAPLAPSLYHLVKDRNNEIAEAIKWLGKLTDGNIYVSTHKHERMDIPAPAIQVCVNGPHPSGNAGVQAANIAPVNKGETIWTLDIVTLAKIGTLAINGTTDWNTEVALVGSEITHPQMISTVAGARLAPLIDNNLKTTGHTRVISGNVLTGVNAGANGYLHYPYRQVTVIPEGDDVDEFMGWASMSPDKMSVNRSFLSSFMPGRKFAPDARINGGRRAMIMSEQYDRVMPMDILPEYLIKAILARDIDQMERLGIYEVAPEDFALCEYVDPSKLEIQKIVREGLDYLRKELE